MPVTDYAVVVEALATRKIDMAWLGGFTFVQASLRHQGGRGAAGAAGRGRKSSPKFITASEGIKGFADPKGQTFAFRFAVK